MNVKLNKTDESQIWDLNGIIITQLIIDCSSIRILNWTLEGAIDIRIEVPFLFSYEDKEVIIDPEDTVALSPILSLLRTEIIGIQVFKTGILEIKFSQNKNLKVGPHQKYEAWEMEGSGNFQGANYLCGIGGGSPWG